MSKQPIQEANSNATSLVKVSDVAETTSRKELFWLKGQAKELEVHRIPIKHLYFNIDNGRYSDKMLQLRADNPGVDIDPRQDLWKSKIMKMLQGEYPGIEGDKEPFQRLRDDLKARQQIRPGVVLSDGGVLNGNRRLAALHDLHATEQNSERFAYFDAVILPPDVTPEDRWRIEAGIQLGRDEQLDYSPINKLLKIKEGLDLFEGDILPQGKTAEEVVADSLFGVSAEEVKENILRIRLIDEYLNFIGKSRAYHEIGERVERFKEAVKALEASKRWQWGPEQIQQLKVALFAHIRDMTMDNWQLREIVRAMGGTGRGRRPRGSNDGALEDFLKLSMPIEQLKTALAERGSQSSIVVQLKEKAEDFIDRMEAAAAVDHPVRLATRAKNNLGTLFDALQKNDITQLNGSKEKIESLPAILQEIQRISSSCITIANSVIAKVNVTRSEKRPH